MRPNKIRQIWAQGGAVYNGWISLSNGFSAELMANAGFDSVTIDQQHGLVYGESVIGLYQAISTTDTVPMTRVPWLDPSAIMQALDAGAYGIICPMVNSVDDARAFVNYASYPPMGGRSYGPIRAKVYGGDDYPAKANTEIVRMAMIETVEALEHCEEIAKVEGVDALYIGPSDLSNSMGFVAGLDQSEPEVLKAIDRILAAARAAGKPCGIHNGTAAYAKNMVAKGMQFVSVGSDAIFIAQGAAKVVSELRDGAGGGGAGSTY